MNILPIINWKSVFDITIENNGEYILSMPEGFPMLLEFYDFPINYKAVPNFHDFMEVCWVYDGRGMYVTDNQEYVIGKGDVFIVSASKIHHIETFSDNPLKLICLIFMPELICKNADGIFDFEYLLPFYLNDTVINHVINANNSISKKIIAGFKTIRDIISSKQTTYQHHVKANMMLILSQLLDFYQDTIVKEKSKIADDFGINKLKGVSDYIHKNFKTNIQLKELADIANCTEEYLSNNFKQVSGLNITDYIVQCRLNAAKRLLAFSKSTIAEIAYATGFNSPNYFNRVFKKTHLISPGDYRQQFN